MPLIKAIDINTHATMCFPFVFLIDTSGSMGSMIKNRPIDKVNRFLHNLPHDLESHMLEAIDFSVIEFNSSARVVREFGEMTFDEDHQLLAGGATMMGEAICMAYQMLAERRRYYKIRGYRYFRPVIFMLTDGASTDDLKRAENIVADNLTKTSFWSAGIVGCEVEQLSSLSKNCLFIDIDTIDVDEFLEWFVLNIIGITMKGLSESRTEEMLFMSIPEGVYQIIRNDILDRNIDNFPDDIW